MLTLAARKKHFVYNNLVTATQNIITLIHVLPFIHQNIHSFTVYA